MSLRFRLNLLVSLLSLTILGLGTWLVIHNARQAVFEEIQSTATLTLQLLDLAFTEPYGEDGFDIGSSDIGSRLVARLGALDQIRHLHIMLEGVPDPAFGEIRRSAAGTNAPAWFTRLVEPPQMEFRFPVAQSDTGQQASAALVLLTDPTDEIEEAWNDARGVLGLLIGFAVITNGVFFFAVGRWLRPLERVAQALEGVEHGDYAARLPAFELPELTALSTRFNDMAEALERSRNENRALTQRSLAIQESERRHLAQELHDELGQSISAIKAVAVSIGKGRGERDAVERAATTITDIASHVYGVVTGLIRRLRPLRLDEFGLVPALEELVDSWNQRHPNSFCRLSVNGHFAPLGEDIEINLYRIVQESLTNAAKHSAASEVHIALRHVDDAQGQRLCLEIVDDGVGFDLDRTRSGLGLLGLRERSEAIGASLALDTAPGCGVSIRITLPIARNVTV